MIYEIDEEASVELKKHKKVTKRHHCNAQAFRATEVNCVTKSGASRYFLSLVNLHKHYGEEHSIALKQKAAPAPAPAPLPPVEEESDLSSMSEVDEPVKVRKPAAKKKEKNVVYKKTKFMEAGGKKNKLKNDPKHRRGHMTPVPSDSEDSDVVNDLADDIDQMSA